MKNKLLFLLVCLIAISMVLIGCEGKKENVPAPSQNEEVVEPPVEETKTYINDEMYNSIIMNYHQALNEFSFDTLYTDEEFENKYPLVSLTLIEHVKRYEDEGVTLTYEFRDIDKNGIDEIIFCADESYGAIYSYNKDTNEVVKIFFQDTMERGTLTVFDNGTIFSQGSGGAALHYYEFGKIVDGVNYEQLEEIEEEYLNENDPPVYRNNKTKEMLEYTSLDEILSKYQ